jgi:ribosomal protein S12 methylthiotransferase accessory factor
MSNYAKHKERSPEDTVFEIRRILNNTGLFTTLEWTGGEHAGACSNRVSIYPLRSLGQNGKGTDELYASASGYAELMERMQNSWLGQKLHGQDLNEYGGFFEFPDEKLMSFEAVVAQNDPYLTDVFSRLNLFFTPQKEAFLRNFARNYYHRTDDQIPVVPYVDIFADRIVWLPFAVITLFGLSNGMCAGNTLEEALVQGFSEVYERFIHKKLLTERITPPEIPRDVLRQYSTWDLIEKIEADGRYYVSVRDCSLGRDYPVALVIITDRKNGTFGMKPGCHPSFAIAVERTLTEAFQGKNVSLFTSSNHTGTEEELNDYHNAINVVKAGFGACPPQLLTGEPRWTFHPWTAWEGLNNHEYLVKLLSHAKANGYRPLIRDSSHMGFPSCHIVIPGIHDVYPVSGTRVREFWTQLKCAESLHHFPALTEEEETRLLRFARFKATSVEYSMGIPFMNYLYGDRYRHDRIIAFLALKHGDYAMAYRLFRQLEAAEKDDSEQMYFKCLMMLSKLLNSGLEKDAALQHIACLFEPEVADRVIYEIEDPKTMLERAFPYSMKCFDCEHCKLAGTYCEYPEAANVYKKIKRAMAGSNVSCEELRKQLSGIVSEVN